MLKLASPSVRFLVLGLVLAFGGLGCRVVVDDDYDYDYESGWDDDWGTLTAEWSVDDSFDRDACYDFGADYLELIVYDSRGRTAAELEADCEDFEASVDLPGGYYAIDATLVDRRNRAVTTTLGLDDVRIYGGDETLLPIDFPADSLR